MVFTLLLVLNILDRPRPAWPSPHSTTTWLSSRCWGRSTPRTSSLPRNASLDVAHDVPGLRVLVLDLTVIQEMSVTIIETLIDLDRELAATGVELRIAGMPRSAAEVAERTTWFQGPVATGRVSATVEDASPSAS